MRAESGGDGEGGAADGHAEAFQHERAVPCGSCAEEIEDEPRFSGEQQPSSESPREGMKDARAIGVEGGGFAAPRGDVACERGPFFAADFCGASGEAGEQIGFLREPEGGEDRSRGEKTEKEIAGAAAGAEGIGENSDAEECVDELGDEAQGEIGGGSSGGDGAGRVAGDHGGAGDIAADLGDGQERIDRFAGPARAEPRGEAGSGVRWKERAPAHAVGEECDEAVERNPEDAPAGGGDAGEECSEIDAAEDVEEKGDADEECSGGEESGAE